MKTPYLSIKQRFLLLVTAAILFGLAPAIHAEGLSGLEDSIKEGNISEENNATNETLTDEINKNKADQIKKLSLAKSIKIKAQHPKNKFLKMVGDTFKKLKKLKTNSLSKLKQFNIPQILKKKKAATRISDVAKLKMPKRIEESENPPSNDSIIVPSPEKEFGFPVDKNDKVRISGEAEVQRLYELACSTISKSPENDAIIQKMKDIANEIFKKYSAYPDLCAISKLYLIDAQARLGIEAEYSNGSASPTLQVEVAHRDFFKRYLQIMIDYAHETNKPNISNLINFINKNRIEKILKNDENAQKAIAFYIDKLEEDSAFLNEYINETAFYGENTDIYVSVVVTTMNAIISDYSALHYYSVMTSDYESAEYLFKSEYKDGKLAFSGVIKDLYDSIPKEVPYHYVAGYDEQNNPIIKTKMVEIYREPERILEVVKSARNAELLKYSHTFLDDENNTNLTQEKVKAISEWLKNYEPDREGKKGTPEKMSQENVDYLHNNAYGPSDYYKNTHVIKNIYFTRNENVKFIDDIPYPTDLISARAEIESSSKDAPFYEYKVKIQNVRLPKRYKYVIMKKDYFTNEYYSKFRVNENNEYEPDPENTEIETPGDIEDPSIPTVAPMLLNKNENKEFKNVINTSENKGTSVACYNCERLFPPLFQMYYNNKYFYNFTNFLHNRKGYAVREKMYDNALYLKNILKENNTEYFKANIYEADKTFLKTGGIEYAMGIGNIEHEYLPVVSQADWFVIDSHGWYSNESGGIAENEVDENGEIIVGKELLRMHVNELLDDNGKSRYSFGMDVLVLSCCYCLKWIGFDLENDKKSDWCYAKGWHKVLPKGIILGYKDDTNFAMTREVLKILSHKIHKIDNKLTNDDLMYMWIEIHEELYSKFIGNGEVKYQTAKEWAIINGKTWISAKPVVVICGYTNDDPSYQFADFYGYSFNK